MNRKTLFQRALLKKLCILVLMAGIYIHIPFCKQACHYCNFHFSTTYNAYKSELVTALIKEIELKSNWIEESIETIYFGGGTPSLLHKDEIEQILNSIQNHYNLDLKEFTFEGNPDDLTFEKLVELKALGVNRLSVGIQSFFDEDLKLMNRAHNESQSFKVIEDIKSVGFENYSIDFIFAQPLLSDEKWKKNLEIAIENKVPHISCYNLTVEEQTALSKFIEKGKFEPISEEKGVDQFKMADKLLSEAGYHHYEISNYALPGSASKHNSSYWHQKNYLGIGPSAHSYINGVRYANVAHNKKYIDSKGEDFTIEELTDADKFNEYLLTHFRLSEGISLIHILEEFPDYFSSFIRLLSIKLKGDLINIEQDKVYLSLKGMLLADEIASEFFVI